MSATAPAAPIPATHVDLLTRAICGVLTTMGDDGQPQSSLVWLDYDGECIRTNTTLERQKGRNLAANAKVSVLVVDPLNTSRFIQVRGDAELITAGAIEHLDELTRALYQPPVLLRPRLSTVAQRRGASGDRAHPRAAGDAGRDSPLIGRYPRPVTLKVTWAQALAWRLQQQYVAPAGNVAVEEVVRRLVGVQAQVASSAELAVRLRRKESEPGEVATALADGRLVKTWAMRGTIHLLTPEEGGQALSLLAAAKSWHRPSWQRYFHMTVAQMEELRFAIREALDGRVLTREELITEVTRQPAHAHLGTALRSGWGTLLKPSAWQGDLAFGPNQGTRVTFTRPDSASSRWAGVPDPDEAGPLAGPPLFGRLWPRHDGQFQRLAVAFQPQVEDVVQPRQRRPGGRGRRPGCLHPGGGRGRPGGRPTNQRGPTAGRLRPVGARPGHAGHQRDRRTSAVRGEQDGRLDRAHRRCRRRGQRDVGNSIARSSALTWFSEAGRPPKAALQEEVARLSSVFGPGLELAVESV